MKCILNVGPAQLEMGMQLNTKFEKGVGNVPEYLTDSPLCAGEIFPTVSAVLRSQFPKLGIHTWDK